MELFGYMSNVSNWFMKTCSIKNCGAEHYAKDLCKKHHKKQWYENNKGRVSRYSKKWNEENNERKVELKERWNRRNKEHILLVQ